MHISLPAFFACLAITLAALAVRAEDAPKRDAQYKTLAETTVATTRSAARQVGYTSVLLTMCGERKDADAMRDVSQNVAIYDMTILKRRFGQSPDLVELYDRQFDAGVEEAKSDLPKTTARPPRDVCAGMKNKAQAQLAVGDEAIKQREAILRRLTENRDVPAKK